MGFIKKNLVFFVIVLVCLLAFLAGAFLAFGQFTSIGDSKQEITSAESRLNNLRFADPAPTEANVEASRENVAELRSVLESIRAELGRGNRLTSSSDGIGVMAGVQQFISEYREKAANHTSEEGELDPIALPDDFAFGFEQYVVEAQPLDDPKRSAVLDQQRQILSYLLDKLFAADPDSIVSVRREVLERDESQSSGGGAAGRFQISPAVSARVPGAIDTLAFSLSFTGYTNSLREFLNSMAKFDLPIVVRSVEVTRPTSPRPSAAAAPAQGIDAIFGGFGGGETQETEEPREAQKPVISENTSTFTVVLEYIEIVLPGESADENI